MSRFAIRLIVVCTVLVLLQAGLFGVVARITSDSFGRVQEKDATEDVARVGEALSREVSTLGAAAGDWGAWDESYRFMRGQEPGYLAANLQPDALKTLNVDMIVFVKPDGTVFASRAVGSSGESTRVPAGLVAEVGSRPPQLRLDHVGAVAQGVMSLPEGPVVFAARPVTTSAADRSPVGYVLFARFLQGAAKSELSSSARLDVSVSVLPATKGLPTGVADTLLAGPAQDFAAPVSPTLMGGYSLVRDYRGRPALILGIEVPRSVTEVGDAAVRSFAMALALFAMLGVGVVAYVMYQDHRTRHRLAEEIRAREAFFAAVSHDLRTPLNSIIGFTGVVLSGAAGALTEEQRRQLGMSYRSAHRLLELINDILRIQAADLGQEPETSVFDVRATVEEVVTGCRPQSAAKGLVLDVAGDSGQLVESDEAMVHRIVTNLVANAIKYTKSGSISVAVRRVDGEVSIAVSDTGEGIPPEAVSHVFDPFFQVPPSEGAVRADSSGLGLAIAQRLTRSIHGRLTVESRLGEGSTFTLHFPASLGEGGRRG